jgi:ADP-ribose pyrophosphatase
MAEPTEPIGSRSVFEGSVIRLDIEEWPGQPPYEVVHNPGAAAILPLLPSNEVLMVKQFRPAVRQILTEIPAGQLDVAGEDALTCASRELFEETGYRHRAIEFLGGYFSSPGFTDEYVHLFWARTESEPESGPEDGIEVVRMPFVGMVDAAREGRVRDVKTAVALLIAAERPPLP